MSETKRKWFWAWDFDKEESWINQMAAAGKVLSKVGFTTYTFEECEPGEYTIRMELLENFKDSKSKEENLELTGNSGAELIGEVNRWAYFRKKSSEDDFELFSDVSSKVGHLNRLRVLLALIGTMELLIGVNNTIRSFDVLPMFGVPIAILLIALGVLILFGFCRISYLRSQLLKENTLFEK